MSLHFPSLLAPLVALRVDVVLVRRTPLSSVLASLFTVTFAALFPVVRVPHFVTSETITLRKDTSHQVVARQGMASYAVRLDRTAALATPSRHPVGSVVAVRSEPEMVGVDAIRNIAPVQDENVFWDVLPVGLGPHYAMGTDRFSMIAQPTVARFVARSHEQPATVWLVNDNLRHDALKNRQASHGGKILPFRWKDNFFVQRRIHATS